MGSDSARISAAPRPFFVTLAERYSPLEVVTRSNCETPTPDFFANACAAGVGCPSMNATFIAGPVICSVTSTCAAGIPKARTASRRGESKQLIVPEAFRRSRFSRSLTRCRSSCDAASIIRAGISSQPISSRKSDICSRDDYIGVWPRRAGRPSGQPPGRRRYEIALTFSVFSLLAVGFSSSCLSSSEITPLFC